MLILRYVDSSTYIQSVMRKLLPILWIAVVATAQAQQLKPLQFREELHDFGSVQEEGGPVLHQFDFTNTGVRPIKILSVNTSCGCTTPDWTREPIPPGKTGFIQASFDPMGRPGYFSKSLTVTTDASKDQVILQIKGEVKPGASEAPEVLGFKSESGHWRLKTSIFNLGKVYIKDEFAAREFPVVNAGSKAVTVKEIRSPAYIRAEAIPKTLEPGAEGKLLVSYNGKMRGLYGFQSDQIEVQTDDESMPVKSFSVYATLEEYFPPLSQKELEKAPQLKVVEASFDLGRIKQENEALHQVTILNTGKTDLIIRSIQPNCTCINAKAAHTTIKPGDNTTLQIAFNPKSRKGTQQKALTIYSNDPQNSAQRVTFTAYVDE